MLLFWQGDFERTVSLLLPLRYHLDAIGGSRDQQDVVKLTLIDAALRLQDPVRPSFVGMHLEPLV